MEPAPARDMLARDAIMATLIERLDEMSADWDRELSDAIGPRTLLGKDLGFSSMDLVMLVVDIEQCYGRHDFPFEDLFAPDGRYVDDVEVAQVVDFIFWHLVPEGGTRAR